MFDTAACRRYARMCKHTGEKLNRLFSFEVSKAPAGLRVTLRLHG